MARGYLGGGGSGSGSDDCTAKKEHILAPYTAITSDSDDEPVAGTLQDKTGTAQQATASLDATNSRLQMTIPATAKYSTASKLYAAYSAIRTLIGLTADKLWTGVTILGLASSRSALAAKTWTPGTSNQTIAAGTCITGAQTIKGDANLKAANIKSGVSMFGVTGSFKGTIKAGSPTYKSYHSFKDDNGNSRSCRVVTASGFGITPIMVVIYKDGVYTIWTTSMDGGTYAKVSAAETEAEYWITDDGSEYFDVAYDTFTLPFMATGTCYYYCVGY